MSAIELSGRPIAITGASSGIGAATAVACARAGMPVAVGARRVDRLERLVERIRSEGGRAIAIGVDVRSAEECRAFVDRAAAEFGGLYAVYANAGYGAEAEVVEMMGPGDGGLRDMFETNFFGSMNVVGPALVHMLRSAGPERGHVLFCSSCLAKMAVPYYGVYCATKAAQNHIARAMNIELRPRGIFVSSVHPIGTKTEFFGEVDRRAGGARRISHTPDWFMQTPEFVAARTLACLRRPRPEVWMGLRGWAVRTGMAMGTATPRLTDWALRRMSGARLAEAERAEGRAGG